MRKPQAHYKSGLDGNPIKNRGIKGILLPFVETVSRRSPPSSPIAIVTLPADLGDGATKNPSIFHIPPLDSTECRSVGRERERLEGSLEVIPSPISPDMQ